MQVNKEFRYAVGGVKPTVFAKGTSADALPEDALAYARRKGLLSGSAAKAVTESPENKAVTVEEDKSTRGRGK
jgi:hypothetical protein